MKLSSLFRLLVAFFVVGSSSLHLALSQSLTPQEDFVFESFEGDDWGDWIVEGSAFGEGPIAVSESVLRAAPFPILGQKMIDTKSISGTAGVGSLTSPVFDVSHDYIHFVLGGGGFFSHMRVLLIDSETGEILTASTGKRSHALSIATWDVSEYRGRQLSIKIEDRTTKKISYVLMDTIVFSDSKTLDFYGALSAERWNGLRFYDVEELVSSTKFHETPTISELGSTQYKAMSTYSGLRLRGYIVPEFSGEYTFWVSATTAAELWLSQSDLKYEKELIANLGRNTGSGTAGVKSNSGTLFDSFVSQQSKTLTLEAGQRYYVEVLSQQHHATNRHATIAWQAPNQERQIIPLGRIDPYNPTPDDLDDDYLPDSWETQYGLNPQDNGLTDRRREGERGDYDDDGLNNRIEYLYNTNPSKPDTDGDSISDYLEIYKYRTNPAQSNLINSSLVGSIPLWNDELAALGWSFDNGKAVHSEVRASGEWLYNIPEAGAYELKIRFDVGIAGLSSFISTLDLTLDEQLTLSEEVHLDAYGESTVVFSLPYLSAGEHRLDLFFNNFAGKSGLTLKQMDLVKVSGVDLNENGVSDLLESALAEESYISETPANTYFSPVILEGRSTLGLADVQLSLDGRPIAVTQGVGKYGWKAILDLVSQDDSIVHYTAQGGVLQSEHKISWVTYPLRYADTLSAREGDLIQLDYTSITSLNLTKPDGESVTYTGDQLSFTSIGTYTLTAQTEEGASAITKVTVYPSEIAVDSSSVLVNRYATLITNLQSDYDDLVIDGASSLTVKTRHPLETGESVNLAVHLSGTLGLGYRLPNGRLATVVPLQSAAFLSAVATGKSSTEISEISDTLIYAQHIMIHDFPEDWTIEVYIFRAGVTFTDGSISKTFTQADFINGELPLQFLFPANHKGGLCHGYTIRDASGNIVK